MDINAGNEITIEQTPNLLAEIQKALKAGESIKLSAEKVESIDLSGIQIIQFLLDKKEKKHPITLSLSFSESVIELLQKSGFSHLAAL